MMENVLPGARTEVRILYQDGFINKNHPNTYSIELRKWDDSYRVDYVLLKSFTANSKGIGTWYIPKYYKIIAEKYILDVKSDSEAISKAVDIFRELKRHCEGNDKYK